MGKERKVYKVLVGNPGGKRLLERPRRGWEDGIKADLSEIRKEDVERIHLALDGDRRWAVVNTAMNIRVLAALS
jgi:hypothetical protein